MIVADEDFVKNGLKTFVDWCRKFGVKEVTVCCSGGSDEKREKKEMRIVSNRLNGMVVNMIFGYGGKEEILDAVRELAKLVSRGQVDPNEVCERDVERYLKVKRPPDLIVKAGNEIPEFLIWQSIYSELYFMDVDWRYFRYVDFLRCLREYQRRERRYGK